MNPDTKLVPWDCAWNSRKLNGRGRNSSYAANKADKVYMVAMITLGMLSSPSSTLVV